MAGSSSGRDSAAPEPSFRSLRNAQRMESVMTKDATRVVHEREQLEEYVQQMTDSEGITFEEWIGQFGGGFYLKRNYVFLDIMRPLRPRRVFEFACAGAYLADLLLANVDSIELYTCSNFSPQMIAYCKEQLARYPQCEVALVDADVRRSSDITSVRLADYDVILTTSLEHIQFDRELIELLPPGCTFVFSVATFDDPEHFRHFTDEEGIRNRYAQILDIISITSVEGYKFVVHSRKP
jgi:hypothetical protein